MASPPKPPGTRIQAIIFDLDGVLVSSIPVHCEAYRRTFAAAGVEFTMDDYMRLGSGASREVTIHRVLGDLPEDRLVELMAEKERHVLETIEERGVEEVPGARRFVESVLERGLKTAVATVGRTPGLFLRGAGLSDLFETVIDRHQVEQPKPAPEVYLAAAGALDVDPRGCIAIEDSPPGVEAGLAAGMRVLALTTTEPAERLSRARAVFPGFDAIDIARWLD